MKMMVDVDGVLADFTKGFTMLGWTKFGTNVLHGLEPRSWDDLGGMTKEQVSAVWKDVNASPRFWEHLPTMVSPAEMDSLNGMIERDGVEVYFVTNRSGVNAKRQTENWLKKYGIEYPTVICTSQKGEFCRAAGVHFSIEDKSENADCIAWISKGITQSFIIDRPYNSGQYAPHSSKVRRMKNVAEFLGQIHYSNLTRQVLMDHARSNLFSAFGKWPTT